MSARKWAGRQVTTARTHWKARLPLPCFRCGKPVLPTQRWQVEHIVERVYGGAHGIGNQWVSHATCNESAGGRIGAAITNTRRAQAQPANGMTPERDRRIRGR